MTLDPDVVRLLDEEAHRARKTFKDVVNDAIRRGLSGAKEPSKRAKRFRAVTHRCALAPGVDVTSFNRLVDELDGEDALRRALVSK